MITVYEGSIWRASSCLANKVVFLAPGRVTLLKEMEEQENLKYQEPGKKHLNHQHGSGGFGLKSLRDYGKGGCNLTPSRSMQSLKEL